MRAIQPLPCAMISDDSFYMELKKDYAPSMVTAFIRLNGTTVGCVANRTESYEDGEKTAEFETGLTARGCEKAADFVNFCDAFNIPVLTLVNVNGYKSSQMHREEDRQGGSPPDLCLCKRRCAQGDGDCRTRHSEPPDLTMNSKSIGSDIVYAWKNASIGMMEAVPAVKIMYAEEISGV